MSILIERILRDIEQLTVGEQMQVLEYLVKQIKESIEPVTVPTKPKHKLSEFRGIAPNLLQGMDAQEWVNQMRDEWDNRDVWRQSE